MQNVFLDTNAALWFMFDPTRLGKNAFRLISNSPEVCLSAISIAEVEIKSLSGKMKFPPLSKELLKETQIEVRDFGASAAMQLARFSGLVGHDAFDRLLLSHAAAEESVFVTSDSVLLGQNLDFVFDAKS
jgi:PIN domain nuclease of toxin-antitoxin system